MKDTLDIAGLEAARKVYNASLDGEAAFGATERIIRAYLGALSSPVQVKAPLVWFPDPIGANEVRQLVYDSLDLSEKLRTECADAVAEAIARTFSSPSSLSPSGEADRPAPNEFLGRCAHCLDNAYTNSSCASPRDPDCLISRARNAAPVTPQALTEGVAGLTAEGYVAKFIRNGEQSVAPLRVWEQAYQDAGLIEEAFRKGYIWIEGDVACTVTVTSHGRTAAKLSEAATALASLAAELAEAKRERDDALDDAKFAERIATKREVDANVRAESAERKLEEQRKALEPFAEIAAWYDDRESDDFEIWHDYPDGLPRDNAKLKHFRRARFLAGDSK